MQTTCSTKRADLFDFAADQIDDHELLRQLRDRGYAVLRNVFPREQLEGMFRAREWWFQAPAVGGAPGYCKFDFEKKVVQTSLLGKDSLQILLNERLLDIIELYTGHEVILSESFTKLDRGVDYVYFPTHTDYAPGYRPSSHYDEISLTREDMELPLGLSYALYHHDTTEGAFCFCAGSHKLYAFRGGMLTDYPKDEQAEIRSTWTRLDGRAGDMVLFDPRGFHGQDQPTTKSRIATISRFWRTDIFGRRQARPVPVYTMDLEGLTDRQLRVLGIGAQSLTPLQFDHHGGFRKRKRAYRLAINLIEHAYDIDHLKRRLQPLRSAAKRLLRPG